MTALHRPVAGHEDMHGNKFLRPRLTRPQRVELNARLLMRFQNLAHDGHVFRRKGHVHEPGNGTAHDADAGPDNVRGHDQRHDRVKPVPFRQHDQTDARHHADGSPHIRQQMMRVGFERDGVVLAARTEDQQGNDQIHKRSCDRHQQAHAHRFQRLRREEPSHRCDGNAHRRHQDQAAFDAAGKIFRLAVAVGVVLVGGPRGHRQHCQRHEAADEVDDGLNRVRQQPDRPRDAPRHRLEHDGDQRGGDGEPGEAG